MKYFFAIVLSIMMLFSLGMQIEFETNLEFPNWMETIRGLHHEHTFQIIGQSVWSFIRPFIIPVYTIVSH
jgi:hypothetical protein